MATINSIDLVGAQIPTSFITGSGTAVPGTNALTITGAGTVTTSASGSTVTVTGSASTPVWNTITSNTSTPMTTNQSYLITFSGKANLVLPTSSAAGDVMYVLNATNSSSYEITYTTGQNIVNGYNSTSHTTITTGNITAAPLTGGTINIYICTVADTQWMVGTFGSSLYLSYT